MNSTSAAPAPSSPSDTPCRALPDRRLPLSRNFFWLLLGVAGSLQATITGTVLVDGSGFPGTPIEGARVHLRADPSSPVVFTDVNGLFSLPVDPDGTVEVSAAVEYDPAADRQFNTGASSADNGDDIVIRLREIPMVDNSSYTPIRAAPPAGCGDCHTDQLTAWQGSAHSLAAVDSWVLDLYSGTGSANGSNGYVFLDHRPGESGFCATCHAPVAEAVAPGTTQLHQVTGAAELEGVTCSACHQLDHFSDNTDALHLVTSAVGQPPGATYRFPLDGIGGAATHEFVWGPLDDVDYAFMRAAWAPQFTESKMCASCHEYVNPDTGAPGQRTYSEWLASSWATDGPGFRSCQDCHMPEASEDGPIADPVIGSAPVRPAAQRHDHSFASASAEGLATALDLTVGVRASNGRLLVDLSLANVGLGHAFPTGVSIRNAVLWVEASRAAEPLDLRWGPTVPSWADDDVPGQQPGDLGGLPGLGFAKVLSGEVAGVRTQPVVFIEADSVVEDSLLYADTTREATIAFDLPTDALPLDQISIRTRLVYRRAWRALAETKGWTTTPTGDPIDWILFDLSDQITLTEEAFPLFADDFERGDSSAWSDTMP